MNLVGYYVFKDHKQPFLKSLISSVENLSKEISKRPKSDKIPKKKLHNFENQFRK